MPTRDEPDGESSWYEYALMQRRDDDRIVWTRPWSPESRQARMEAAMTGDRLMRRLVHVWHEWPEGVRADVPARGSASAAEPGVAPAHDHRGNTPEGERIECPYPGCDIGHPRTKEESIAFRKAWDKRLAAPGVAVPEPDEQRCPHGETEAHSWPKPLGRAYCPGPDKRCADCLGSGQTMEHYGTGGWADMREVDCETCDGTGHVPGPAASPVAQEDGEQK